MNNLYLPIRKDTVVLSGHYESRYFEISSFMGHPNAYVSFPEGEKYNTWEKLKDFWDNLEYKPHGGFTFIGRRKKDLLMAGWDYNHLGDLVTYEPIKEDGKKWTLEEIFTEVVNVIDAINSAC